MGQPGTSPKVNLVARYRVVGELRSNIKTPPLKAFFRVVALKRVFTSIYNLRPPQPIPFLQKCSRSVEGWRAGTVRYKHVTKKSNQRMGLLPRARYGRPSGQHRKHAQ